MADCTADGYTVPFLSCVGVIIVGRRIVLEPALGCLCCLLVSTLSHLGDEIAHPPWDHFSDLIISPNKNGRHTHRRWLVALEK